MRTEDDLRAALRELERQAPDAARVMPGAGSRRRAVKGRHRPAWHPLTAAAAVAVAAAAATAAIAAIIITVAATGTPARPDHAITGGSPHAALRTAILTAFSSARGDIVYMRLWETLNGQTWPVQQTWYSPWLVEPGQLVRQRLMATDSSPGHPTWRPIGDEGQVYTLPATGLPAKAATIEVNYGNRTWSAGNQPTAIESLGDLSDIRRQVANGRFAVVGHPEVDGQRTAKLRLTIPAGPHSAAMTILLWVNADTYLPVQESSQTGSPQDKGGPLVIRTTFQFLPPTSANMALLKPPVPAGFHRTPASGN